MGTKQRQRFQGLATGILAVAIMLGSALWADPAGPPPTPMAGPVPNSSLKAHALQWAPGPVDNPLKGFAAFYFFPVTSFAKAYSHTYPFSLEWQYFPLSAVMKGWDRFDWEPVEKVLDQAAARGHQAVIRFYLEYPGEKSGIPPFLVKSGIRLRKVKEWNTQSPDYDDPRTIKCLTQFISALGARYDGDGRVGYITMGLVGLWGEWHTWPSPELFPTEKTCNIIIDDFVQAFHKTQVLLRYGHIGGGHAEQVPIGFHDDSFAFKGDGTPRKSVTLPQSMGGWDWSFMEHLLMYGGENRWIHNCIGGEVRPDIQQRLFKAGTVDVDDFTKDVEITHATWLMNQKGVELTYKLGDPVPDNAVRKMGYDLSVTGAYFKDQVSASEPLKIGLTMENSGVAPLYYAWPVLAAVRDQAGNIAHTWETGWDLRDIMPKQIRALPDWGLGPDPHYLDFGKPRYFEFQAAQAGLAPGKYQWLIRVRNPLEDLGEKELTRRGRLSGQKVRTPLPLRFANKSQEGSGWLVLGDFVVQP